MSRKPLTERRAIGIAIGAHAVTGTLGRGAAAVSASVALPAVNGTGWAEAVRAACTELRARLDTLGGARTAGLRAHVALLPPHAETRLVPLPPLRAAEAEAVLRRDAGRHFVSVPAPQVIGVLPAPARATAPAPVLAAAANAQHLDAIAEAVAHAGWRMASVTSAHAAWLGAANALTAAPRCVIAADAGTLHILQLRAGHAHALRRLPLAALDDAADDLFDAAGAEPGGVTVHADVATRQRIAALLSSAGWSVVGSDADAAEVAARSARTAGLRLVAPNTAAQRVARERRMALRLAAAALVLLTAAGVVELWGAQRELAAVRAQRAAIRADVGPLLELRDSADRLAGYTAAIDGVAAEAPRWTAALFDLALLLPPETHLTRLHTSGDTLIVEAEGTRAGAALQALRTAPTLRDARLLGTVDRELADGTTTVERFRLSARLDRTAAAAVTPARTAAQTGGRP